MKFINTRFLALFFVLSAGLFLSSCGEDEPILPIITPDPPVVTLVDQDGQLSSSVMPGATISFTGRAIGGAAIATVNIYVGTTQVETYSPSGLTEFQVPAYSYTTLEADKGTDVIVTYEAIDVNGKTGEATYTITVLAETPLAYENTGAILGNRIGPDEHFSAWNLVANVREAAGANSSDMQNPSIATGTIEQQWIKGWDGENGSLFVKANNFDYANATVESASATYAEGTALTEVRDVAVGDIYIAKLRGQDVYVAINITVVDDAVTSGSRIEEIDFTYKKASETSGQ